MIIGFDGKRAVQNNTGLGNYSRLLVEVLATRFPEHLYALYAPKLRPNPRLKPLMELDNVELHTPDTASGRTFGALWRSRGITSALKEDKVSLYHGLSGELPMNIAGSGIPSVVTIHDLIFRRFPECYSAVDRRIYDYKFRHAAERADRIIAISECTRRAIMEFYNIPAESA